MHFHPSVKLKPYLEVKCCGFAIAFVEYHAYFYRWCKRPWMEYMTSKYLTDALAEKPIY